MKLWTTDGEQLVRLLLLQQWLDTLQQSMTKRWLFLVDFMNGMEGIYILIA